MQEQEGSFIYSDRNMADTRDATAPDTRHTRPRKRSDHLLFTQTCQNFVREVDRFEAVFRTIKGQAEFRYCATVCLSTNAILISLVHQRDTSKRTPTLLDDQTTFKKKE